MKKKPVKREVRRPSLLVVAPLLLVFLASSIWGVLNLSALLPVMLTATDVDNYRPARFVVEDVVYTQHRRGGYSYYARGRIDGQPEEFELSAVAPVLETREALEEHFGQKPVSFAVMYNPNRTRSTVNAQSLRVRPAFDGFAEQYRNTAWFAFVNILASVVVAGTVLMIFRWMGERLKTR
jgi:hypothetical protein